MPLHEYTPEQALEFLIRALETHDMSLAAEIRTVVNAGKDIFEEVSAGSGSRKKPRRFRRTIPFTHEEALQAAVGALQAYFVEHALFINSCLNNFAKASIGTSRSGFPLRSVRDKDQVTVDAEGADKAVVIELQTATQISPSEAALTHLERRPLEEIETQRKNLSQLNDLFEFNE